MLKRYIQMQSDNTSENQISPGTTLIVLTLNLGSVDERLVIPYGSGRKYWREINMAVGPKIVIVNILTDLKLAVAIQPTAFPLS